MSQSPYSLSFTGKESHMKIAGIIAEYNPFHNGHQFQIDQLKQETGADYVVIAMSGNFLQRGVPAIVDKYARLYGVFFEIISYFCKLY